jgi:NADH:ubiquinone oxidoreductase subunit 2 (subunit N)
LRGLEAGTGPPGDLDRLSAHARLPSVCVHCSIGCNTSAAALWPLLVVMMVTSGIGLFDYLRVIVTMCMEPAGEQTAGVGLPRLPLVAGVTLTAHSVTLVWLGVDPPPIIRLIRIAVTGGG